MHPNIISTTPRSLSDDSNFTMEISSPNSNLISALDTITMSLAQNLEPPSPRMILPPSDMFGQEKSSSAKLVHSAEILGEYTNEEMNVEDESIEGFLNPLDCCFGSVHNILGTNLGK